MTTEYDKFYIGGEWIDPASDRTIEVLSASTEARIGQVPDGIEEDVDRAVAAARRAFDDPTGWAHWTPAERADAMERLAAAIDARSAEIAHRISNQNGMPITTSTGIEAVFPTTLLRFYAAVARNREQEEHRAGMIVRETIVRREPVGVVGAIVPWNFPQTLAFLKIGPALAAGCTLVMKPSPETVLDGFLLAEAIDEARIPAGVINIVPGGREVGAYLVAHPQVDKVAFTGSTAAGRQVAETCGRLLRPVTLELGGKSAAIVLDDANFDEQTLRENLFVSTLTNNGQTCWLCTRVLAPRSRYDEIVDLITDMASSATVGDALDPATQIGPLASSRHRDRVEGYIAKGLGEGARLTTGGGRPKGLDKGWFVEPTVFADVDNNSVIAQEEIFGPVLSVVAYDSVDDAVRLANDSDYGLGGTVWSADEDRALDVARRVQTGTIGLNVFLPEINAPFGGVKASGMGYEFGAEAIGGYEHLKTIFRR